MLCLSNLAAFSDSLLPKRRQPRLPSTLTNMQAGPSPAGELLREAQRSLPPLRTSPDSKTSNESRSPRHPGRIRHYRYPAPTGIWDEVAEDAPDERCGPANRKLVCKFGQHQLQKTSCVWDLKSQTAHLRAVHFVPNGCSSKPRLRIGRLLYQIPRRSISERPRQLRQAGYLSTTSSTGRITSLTRWDLSYAAGTA